MKSTVFIGIDVSNETIDATVLIPSLTQGQLTTVHYGKYDNRPAGFRKLVADTRKVAKGIKPGEWLFCCETTGSYDLHLCCYMVEKGFHMWRESALEIRYSCGVKLEKNDKADSKMIAEYACRNADKAKLFVIPDEKIQALKSLFNFRQNLSKRRCSLMVRANTIKATTRKSEAGSFIYRESISEARRLEKAIAECEKQMLQIVKSDDTLKRHYDHMKSIKGVGLVTSMCLLAYTADFQAITTPRAAARYAGSAVVYKISGTSVFKRVELRNFSNLKMKAALSQCAASAMRHNPDIRDYSQRLLARGKTKKLTANNVRSKLLHIIYSLIAHDQDWEPNHEQKSRARQTVA